jgi:hypothetical protein
MDGSKFPEDARAGWALANGSALVRVLALAGAPLLTADLARQGEKILGVGGLGSA